MTRTRTVWKLFAPLVLSLLLYTTGRAEDKPGAAEAPVVPPKTGQRETIQLFNGKDLAGWKGHEKYWSVKDGVIIGKNTDPIGVSTYLLTEREFSDFRLVFDFKLAESEMHSGISMWGRIAPDKGDPFTYAGHLVMFPSNYGFWDLYGRSGIHQNATIAKPVGKQHDWNHMEILAQGNRIRFVLNGTLISDWREPKPELIKEAPLGLQLHSNKVAQEVQFKNLVLETFPEDKLTTQTAATSSAGGEKVRMYVGTYTGGKNGSKGIYRLELDLASGQLSQPVVAAESTSPSFLALSPNQKFLYAVNEGGKEGMVSGWSVDPASGELTALNQQSVGGSGPCHLTVDREGKNVLAANYGGGSVAVIAIGADGKLGERTAFVQHTGSGGDPKRQAKPHAHSVNVDADNRFAFVADLGLDKVLVYKFDAAKGTIVPNDPPALSLAPASGPRHFAFHPNGRRAYVINEMTSTVSALEYDPKAGVLKELQTVSTLPATVPGNSTAEVQVHPSGKFLYGSNRGHNSIATFTIDAESGKLTPTGHQTKDIKTPRNFGIDPSGAFLVVANQGADSLVVFRIDQQTGALQPTGVSVVVPSPVCVKFVKMN
jgi:6-phosphogluconolactonase